MSALAETRNEILSRNRTGIPLEEQHNPEPPPQSQVPPTPPVVPVVIPEWARLLSDTTKTGEIAAKAIAVDFERAAAEIETLGHELVSMVEAHSSMIEQARTAMGQLFETAQRYRGHGAELLQEIQLSSRKIAAIFEHNTKLKAALTDMETHAADVKK